MVSTSPRYRILPLSPLRGLVGCLFGLLLLIVGPAIPVFASPANVETWFSANGDRVQYRFQAGTQQDADQFIAAYDGYVTRAVDEIQLVLAVDLPQPVTIYVYTDESAFGADLSGAAGTEISGIGAIAAPEAQEISLLASDWATLSPIAAENEIRHAVAHLEIAVASDNKAPRGLTEGLARYLERPVTERTARDAALLQLANQRGGLASWFDMNRYLPELDQDLMAAQSYAVVAFLIERYDLGPLRQFLTELKRSASWGEALRTAYGRDPNAVEKQWKDDLPRWVNGGWKYNLVSAFDLDPARVLLATGSYESAKQVLEPSQALFRQLDAPQLSAEVDRLLAQCDTGIQAESLMRQAEQSLTDRDYARASTLLTQARKQYSDLPAEQTPTDLLASYEGIAADGLQAAVLLDEADRMSERWLDYRSAEGTAREAGTIFARIGDADGTARAQTLIARLEGRQQRFAMLMGALILLTIGWLVLWSSARGPAQLVWREGRGA